MYVNIGSYPKTYVATKIQNRFMEYKYGSEWYEKPNAEFTVVDTIVFWLDEAVQKFYDWTINPILDKRKQKVVVRVDDHDTWNADVTLARIIHPVLCALRKDLYSYATVDDEDVPETMRNGDDNIENGINRWHWVLDEMIFAFECSKTLDDIGTGTLGEYIDRYKRDEARVKNGLRLFGKYYQSLWT